MFTVNKCDTKIYFIYAHLHSQFPQPMQNSHHCHLPVLPPPFSNWQHGNKTNSIKCTRNTTISKRARIHILVLCCMRFNALSAHSPIHTIKYKTIKIQTSHIQYSAHTSYIQVFMIVLTIVLILNAVKIEMIFTHWKRTSDQSSQRMRFSIPESTDQNSWKFTHLFDHFFVSFCEFWKIVYFRELFWSFIQFFVFKIHENSQFFEQPFPVATDLPTCTALTSKKPWFKPIEIVF